MERIKVDVLRGKHVTELPIYQTAYSAGMDIEACLKVDSREEFEQLMKLPKHDAELVMSEQDYASIIIAPGGRALIPSGLKFSIPAGYQIEVRPRSGLAVKHGVTCLNTPGTIDSDYRGDIGIILINLGNTPFVVEHRMRIAQLVLMPAIQVEWNDVLILDETVRGEGGFGHTGVKS